MTGIAGAALVVPGLRAGLAELRRMGAHDTRGPLHSTHEPCGGRLWPLARVAPESLEDVAAHPRLRRAGKVSLLAAAAAKDALADAALDPRDTARIPCVFVTSDGGVSYTARFYGEVTLRGTGGGSPLLFPETVYNAPASHTASFLGSPCEFSTLVGDASAAAGAVAQASLLISEGHPNVLVLAANECDPLACAGYSRWGFVENPLFPGGHVLADGAAALVLCRSTEGASARVEAALQGRTFRSKEALLANLAALLSTIPQTRPPLFLPACRKTVFEAEEAAACPKTFRNAQHNDPKEIFGESLAASPLVATVAWLGEVFGGGEEESAVISAVGFSGGVAALHLTKRQA